jgi:hypothetical protein
MPWAQRSRPSEHLAPWRRRDAGKSREPQAVARSRTFGAKWCSTAGHVGGRATARTSDIEQIEMTRARWTCDQPRRASSYCGGTPDGRR